MNRIKTNQTKMNHPYHIEIIPQSPTSQSIFYSITHSDLRLPGYAIISFAQLSKLNNPRSYSFALCQELLRLGIDPQQYRARILHFFPNGRHIDERSEHLMRHGVGSA